MAFNIEKIFLSALGSPDKLKWFLQNNINLVNYVSPALIFSISLIPKTNRKTIMEKISLNGILQLLEKDRPDLFKTLTTQNGRIWLELQISNFKKRFL